MIQEVYGQRFQRQYGTQISNDRHNRNFLHQKSTSLIADADTFQNEKSNKLNMLTVLLKQQDESPQNKRSLIQTQTMDQLGKNKIIKDFDEVKKLNQELKLGNQLKKDNQKQVQPTFTIESHTRYSENTNIIGNSQGIPNQINLFQNMIKRQNSPIKLRKSLKPEIEEYSNDSSFDSSKSSFQQTQQINTPVKMELKSMVSMDSDYQDIFADFRFDILNEEKYKQFITKYQETLHLSSDKLLEYFSLFLQFSLLKDSKINEFTFVSAKIPRDLFQYLIEQLFITIDKYNYLQDAQEKMKLMIERNQNLILNGTVLDEIGGIRGLERIIRLIVKKLLQSLINPNLSEFTSERLIVKFQHQLRFLLIDFEEAIPLENMKKAHKYLNITYSDFFVFKFIAWNVFLNLQISPTTSYRFLEILERQRYNVIVQNYSDYLFTNDEIYKKFIQKFTWQINKQKIIFNIFNQDTELYEEFCKLMVNELVFRKKYRYDPVIFLKSINFKNIHFDIIQNEFQEILKELQYPDHFIPEIKMKIYKLRVKCGVEINVLEQLGGYKRIPTIINMMKELIQSGDAFQDLIQGQNENQQQKLDLILREDIQDLNRGLDLFEYLFLNFFVSYDTFGIDDFTAGFNSYQVQKSVIIIWKYAFELTLTRLGYNYETTKTISHRLNMCYLESILDQETQEEIQIYKETLLYYPKH